MRSFVGKIQKGLSVFAPRTKRALSYQLEAAAAVAATIEVVPDDVTEGHFAVLAIKGEEIKRFIIELDYLNDPAFLGLLDMAEEEYGFRQKGALAVPCRPQEVQRILDERKVEYQY
ncbi:hypothetical protein L6164_033698 [Bauhinia variegata]|uniref:Uncharacterized protein n=1 Tax=Bauhinia variegata TaxID=167791 RepID=A0ACB9KSR5_BAUVA|nr:hypothetical protein L6164_033698 [Bauhinia variegata]